MPTLRKSRVYWSNLGHPRPLFADLGNASVPLAQLRSMEPEQIPEGGELVRRDARAADPRGSVADRLDVGSRAYTQGMVSTELLTAVDALSQDEHIELVAHIAHTLDADVRLDPEQQSIAESRLATMKADPAYGLTLDEAIAAARALIA
jgi:putative addiction module component (TIGR02574 family)